MAPPPPVAAPVAGVLWRQQGRDEREFPALDADLIEITLAGTQRVETWANDARAGLRNVGAADVAFVPAGTRVKLQGSYDADVLHLLLQPDLVGPALSDARTGGSIEPLRCVKSAAILRLGLRLMKRQSAAAPPTAAEFETIALELAHEVAGQFSGVRAPAVAVRPALSRGRLRTVLERIHDDLASDVYLDELAAIAGLSKYHFLRSFKSALGMPPHQYQLLLRLSDARRRLARSTEGLGAVSSQLGFSSQSHFSSAFSAACGLSPGAYRALFQR